MGKDSTDSMLCCDVVYKISCQECEATYVGQTKQQLKTRVKEHLTDINKRSSSLSVISKHRFKKNYEFKWDDVNILDVEPSYYKRLVSEMIYYTLKYSIANSISRMMFIPISLLLVGYSLHNNIEAPIFSNGSNTGRNLLDTVISVSFFLFFFNYCNTCVHL